MDSLRRSAVALATVAALALSSCSGGGTDTAATPAAGGKLEGQLSIANWQFLEPNRGDALLKVMNGYTTATPGVSIKKVEIARADYEKTLSTQFGAGGGPDIFVIPDAFFPQLSDAGVLEPLDDVVSSARPSGLRDINKNYAVDGSQLAVLWEVVPYALFWNKDILAAAGVKPPTTASEIVTAANKIKTVTGKTGFTVRHQMNEETPWWTDYSNWAFGYGAQWSDGKTLTINSEKNIAALNAYREVYNAPGFGKGQDASTYRSAFAAGQLGMSIDNSSAVKTLISKSLPANKIGSAVLPFPAGGSAYAGFAIGVNAKSKNKAAAKDFIRWMLTPAVQPKFADALFPSAIATDVKPSSGLIAANPWVNAFFEQTKKANSVIIKGFETKTAEIRTIVLTQVARALTQGVPAKDVLDEAQKQAAALTS